MTKGDSRAKQAEAAVRKFQRMIPALRSYARKASGNPNLILKAGPNSLTDGKTIWIEPPVKLGLVQRHNGMCNTQADGMSVCPACATTQEVMEILNHEIGHILYGSFDKFDMRRAESVCLKRGGYVHDLDNDTVAAILRGLPTSPTALVGAVNQARDPWLSMLMLIGEDIRCDEARMNFDPLERDVFEAMSMDYLINGVHKVDGTVQRYIDLEDDMQLCMAYLFSARFTIDELEGFFKDELLEVVGHKDVMTIVASSLEAIDTVETFALAAQALSFFRKEGYLAKPERDEELDELIKAIQELLKLMFGHGIQIDGPDEPESSDSFASKKIGGAAGGSAKDGLRPKDIADALASLEHLDRVPENVGVPKVYAQGKGPAYDHAYRTPIPVSKFKSDERNLVPALTQARIAFGDNARTQRIRNQRSGRVSGRTLAKRVPFGDDRLFAKRITPDKKDYAVVIGLDISGSTSGETLREEKFAAMAMADVLHRLGIKFEMWAHCTEMDDSYLEGPSMYAIKTADEAWGDKPRNALRTIDSYGANLDGHTLQFYRKRLESMRATEHILMYYTDGAMPASNYTEELEVLKSEIEYCRKNNITLMAVGMGVDTPRKHGFDTCQVDSPKDYRKVVEHLGKRLQ
ncbi:CobT-like cobalamin biosynthesis protein [Gordonia phage PokyPuppy]|nr:CobT-like cobalamin biosynthesis protein [Gordonia phage PokyPuppy]